MSLFCGCCCSTVILLVVGLLGLLKVYVKATTGIYKGKERLDGKTAVITGASAGIGAESAKDLARRGARVVMLCRDMIKGERVRKDIELETGNKSLVLKHIDFVSLTSVRKCANEILNEEPQIDILLNNAGAGGLGLDKKTADGLEKLMQVNHFGPFLFTNILLGKVKQSAPSRIVNVSSEAHKFAKLDLDHLDQSNTRQQPIIYSNTKLANIYFTVVLAEKLKGTGVTVNSLHPGVVLTDITRNAGQLFRSVWDGIIKLFFKSAWEGAQTQIYLCVSPSVANVSGKYFSDCKEASVSKAAKDYQQAERLWVLSEKAVKLQDNEKHF